MGWFVLINYAMNKLIIAIIQETNHKTKGPRISYYSRNRVRRTTFLVDIPNLLSTKNCSVNALFHIPPNKKSHPLLKILQKPNIRSDWLINLILLHLTTQTKKKSHPLVISNWFILLYIFFCYLIWKSFPNEKHFFMFLKKNWRWKKKC